MNSIVDTHTHLESFYKKGLLSNALDAAVTAGVTRMVTVGTDGEDWELYAGLAESQPETIDYTVGVHPTSVGDDWESLCDRISAYFERQRPPVALGEIGLDRFHLPKDPAESERILQRQKAAFREQLEIAKSLDSPVVIHSRGAFAECVEEIDRSGVDWPRVVFHCFSEGPGEMQQLLDRGGYGSFTGIITFKNAEPIRDAAILQGIDRMMIETDAPYLSPVPHRGKPNEPAYLRHTADFCREMFGMDDESFARQTTENAYRVYGLDG
ncbi:MAG TPA: TatD family deoxyribonuclease [Opitutae bacterium]|nr:hydrolase TatD [Opitutaceae bacterium]HCR30289.1 TatD family deoxyribonuclease [Opitutae bacterium]